MIFMTLYDLCGEPANYEGRTTMGPWAYMCESCFKKQGIGLGLGKGQKLSEIGKKKDLDNYEVGSEEYLQAMGELFDEDEL